MDTISKIIRDSIAPSLKVISEFLTTFHSRNPASNVKLASLISERLQNHTFPEKPQGHTKAAAQMAMKSFYLKKPVFAAPKSDRRKLFWGASKTALAGKTCNGQLEKAAQKIFINNQNAVLLEFVPLPTF